MIEIDWMILIIDSMNKYLMAEILEVKDYLEWKEFINKVNEEYHDNFHYDSFNSIIWQRCHNILWNWRPRSIVRYKANIRRLR